MMLAMLTWLEVLFALSAGALASVLTYHFVTPHAWRLVVWLSGVEDGD